ncbi:type II toxin-antitoxin system VapC family toxin [Thermodesulfobacteriota bacterium]
MTHVLLDTGPWVALIDRSEKRHKQCVEWFQHFNGEIFSSEAVLTEVLYLLAFSARAQAAALDFVLTGAVVLVPQSIESLKQVKSLMKKYKDLPMDFADATLIVLAKDLGIDNIVTLDKKHFGIYRIGKQRYFNLLP